MSSLHHISHKKICYFFQFIIPSRRDRDLKSCQHIASNKSNLLKKVLFLLKSGFQVISQIFILLEVGHRVTIVVNFSYKGGPQSFSGHYKIMPDWFIYLEYFSDWWFNFIVVTWLCYFCK